MTDHRPENSNITSPPNHRWIFQLLRQQELFKCFRSVDSTFLDELLFTIPPDVRKTFFASILCFFALICILDIGIRYFNKFYFGSFRWPPPPPHRRRSPFWRCLCQQFHLLLDTRKSISRFKIVF